MVGHNIIGHGAVHSVPIILADTCAHLHTHTMGEKHIGTNRYLLLYLHYTITGQLIIMLKPYSYLAASYSLIAI